METKDKLYYYHNDINGAPLRLTDESGNIVWNAHYDIFGKIDKLKINEVHNPIRMQGQYEDEETGLYYNRYRYYDPVISAYVSQDPLGLIAGENVYSYTLNSFGWIDPMGLSCKKSGSGNNKNDIVDTKGKKRGPKTNGEGPHNQKIKEVGESVKDGKIIAGGGVLPEKSFNTPNGIKKSRRPDILVEKSDGSIYGINVGKTTSTGAPIKREAQAINDLEDIGIPMHYVPYD